MGCSFCDVYKSTRCFSVHCARLFSPRLWNCCSVLSCFRVCRADKSFHFWLASGSLDNATAITIFCDNDSRAKIFDLEPETKKKISGARAKKNVSAQQHWFLSRWFFFLNMTCGVTFSKYFEWEDRIQCQKLDLTKIFMYDFWNYVRFDFWHWILSSHSKFLELVTLGPIISC